MKLFKPVSAFAILLLGSVVLVAQDPLKVDAGHYKVLAENATVRVLKVDYAAGAKSAMHQHPDALIVPLSEANVRFTMAGGKSEDAAMGTESATFTPATTHSVTNLGKGRIDGILLEFKSAAPGKATIPTSRPNMAIKVLADGPRAVAYRVTADPSFQEPAGSKHEYDQVVIALGPSQMSLSIDGKPAKSSWARGDVQLIGRGVPHESKNAGGKPVDFIIVGIK
jgi:quercetin dioxygenase-like cupin family protein